MIKPELCRVVYRRLFPDPRPNDPTSFAAHVSRNIVPEVRIETANFYGTLDCIEAQYPGLDYSAPAHRMRLGRFKHHRQLFRVFDELRLTPDEIRGLCRWEGTKWARDRYEREENVTIRDTTGDEVTEVALSIPPTAYLTPSAPPADSLLSTPSLSSSPSESVQQDAQSSSASSSPTPSSLSSHLIDERPLPQPHHRLYPPSTITSLSNTPPTASTSSFPPMGPQLTRQLLERTAARQAGIDVVIDEQWEAWLKEVSERGALANLGIDMQVSAEFGGGFPRRIRIEGPSGMDVRRDREREQERQRERERRDVGPDRRRPIIVDGSRRAASSNMGVIPGRPAPPTGTTI